MLRYTGITITRNFGKAPYVTKNLVGSRFFNASSIVKCKSSDKTNPLSDEELVNKFTFKQFVINKYKSGSISDSLKKISSTGFNWWIEEKRKYYYVPACLIGFCDKDPNISNPHFYKYMIHYMVGSGIVLLIMQIPNSDENKSNYLG